MPYDDEKIKKSAYTKTDESTKPRNYISSGHFKKSIPINTKHNDRELSPSYLIGDNFEINRNSKEALELKEKIIAKAKKAYTQHTGQNFKAKSYEWSLVVNLKPESKMEDLEKLSEHFFTKYGFQCYQIAIHRDEGHINEQGEKVINHHAHLEFITLDKQTGKNRQRNLKPQVLREIQDEIAEILQMQRGEDKRLSGRQRIEPRLYAQMKEQEKRERKGLEQELQNLKRREKEIIQELENIKKEKETILNQVKNKKDEILTKKQITAYIELIRKQSIGKDYPKEFFRELSNFKKEVIQNNKKLSLKEIQERINKIFKPFDEMLKENKVLKQEQERQQSKIKALESDLKQKEQKIKDLSKEINKNDLRGNFEANKTLSEKEQKELKELDEKIKELENKPKKVTEAIELDNLKRRKNELLGIKVLSSIEKFQQEINPDNFKEILKYRLRLIDKHKKDIKNNNEPEKALKNLIETLEVLEKENPQVYNYCLENHFKNDLNKWLNQNFKLSKSQGKSL